MCSGFDEASLLNSLRAGDEIVFTSLVEQYHSSLVRVARLFVHDDAIADELAQETWLAVLQGLDRFEARSSFKTWLFTILTNKAKTRGKREQRSIVFSEMDEAASNLPAVNHDRFNPSTAEKYPGHWAYTAGPNSWAHFPEETLASNEVMDLITQAIEALPEHQRLVITLRDVNEFSSEEVCNIMGVSETNQRVLLHRARASWRIIFDWNHDGRNDL